MKYLGIRFNQPAAVLSFIAVVDALGRNLTLGKPLSNDDGSGLPLNPIESILDDDLSTGFCAVNFTAGFIRFAFEVDDSTDLQALSKVVIASQTSPYGTSTITGFVAEVGDSNDVNNNEAWTVIAEINTAAWLDGVAQSFDLTGVIGTPALDQATITGNNPTITNNQPILLTADTPLASMIDNTSTTMTVDQPVTVSTLQPNACLAPSVSAAVSASVESTVEVGFSGVQGDVVLASVCVKISVKADSVQAAVLSALQAIDWAGMVQHA